LQSAVHAAKKEGAHAQIAISYTTGPVFTTEYYVDYAKRIEEAGADSICIKDMAALLTPYKTAELVQAIKSAVSIPVDLHTHYTSGLASMCLLKGIEAGADIIDTAMSPLAQGTSHAPTESMVAALQGTEYDTGLDLIALSEVREYFMTLREKYIKEGLLDPKMLTADAKALIYQVPGGMLSNLLSQLKQAGKEDKLTEVLEEVPRVRKDAGYPPLVTPTSQIVGTQAVFNVILGERYKMCNDQFKDLVAGMYGKTPVEIDPEFRKKIIGDRKPVTCRPADLIEPELDKLRKECAQWTEQEEDVLSYAMFPKVAPGFFEKRKEAKYGIDGKHADAANKVHPV
ncbi:MAG: pyruvate carboxylase subunit B, partial [Acutalibacteraceae bacterium]